MPVFGARAVRSYPQALRRGAPESGRQALVQLINLGEFRIRRQTQCRLDANIVVLVLAQDLQEPARKIFTGLEIESGDGVLANDPGGIIQCNSQESSELKVESGFTEFIDLGHDRLASFHRQGGPPLPNLAHLIAREIGEPHQHVGLGLAAFEMLEDGVQGGTFWHIRIVASGCQVIKVVRFLIRKKDPDTGILRILLHR